VGVAVYGRDETVLRLNPAAEAILDEAFADAAATTGTRAAALLRGVRRQVDGAEGSAELTTPGGRTLRGRLAPLTAPDGQSNPMVVFEDVTEFLDNKRQALNAQLARQVAHEVKNPLTPIQLSVQFLQQAWRDGAGDMDGIVDRTVKQVLEQVELLRRIATEFSLLGRPDDLDRVPLDFAAVVRDVTGRYVVPGAAGEGPRILGLDDGDPPAVLGDAESLAKVVGNLMENSLQAVASVEALNVQISWVVTDATVTLHWADDGPGLPPDVADRLFDLYFSTKSRGTGLGLPICRNLLARMGGEIRLSNRGDRSGALAEVVLQRADARPATPHEDPEGPR
jgi:nitrogen fixation/metabolism regulation signal transduction histidine kinase